MNSAFFFPIYLVLYLSVFAWNVIISGSSALRNVFFLQQILLWETRPNLTLLGGFCADSFVIMGPQGEESYLSARKGELENETG